MITKRQKKIAREIGIIIDKFAKNHRITDASREEILRRFSVEDLSSMKALSPIGKFDRQLCHAISRDQLCMNCGKYIAGYRNNRSICLVCIKNGVDSRQFKAESIARTCRERYGVDNVFQAEQFKEKSRVTCLEKYGDTNVAGRNSSKFHKFKSLHKDRDFIKMRTSRAKESYQRRFGEDITHWTQVPGAIETFKKNFEKKHGKGITNSMHLEKNRMHHASVMSDLNARGVLKEARLRGEATNLKLHGVKNIFEDVEYIRSKRMEKTGYEYPLQDPAARKKFKETCHERFGASHYMKNHDFFFNHLKSTFTMKLYECAFRKRTYEVIGSGEVFFLKWALTKFKPKDLLSGRDVPSFDLSDERSSRRYYPDFYIKSQETFVEIKSLYTLLGAEKHGFAALKGNKRKAKACVKKGIKLVWVVSDTGKIDKDNGYLCRLPDDWYKMSIQQIKKYVQRNRKLVETVSQDQFQCRLLSQFGRRESSRV